MRVLWQDLKYTLRRLRNAPVYTLTAVLTLGLGLGAVTAMLAIVDSVLIRPVALPHAEQLVHVGKLTRGVHEDIFLPRDIEALQSGVKSFASVAAYTSLPSPVTTASGTRVAMNLSVLPGFFDVPGVPARLGRLPSAKEGTLPWAVVSDTFWRETLHGDPHAVGTGITAAGRPLTILGVLPPDFRFPESVNGSFLITPLVLGADGKDANHLNANSEVAVRLRAGVTLAAALSEAKAVYAHLPPVQEYDRGVLTFSPYRDTVVGGFRPALFALLGACSLVLLIACANAGTLQIARANAQLPEIRLRAALGATRRRLFRQVVTESLTVSLVGAGVGLALAAAALHGMRATYSLQFPRFDELAIHPAAFAACASLAVLAGVLAALAPAWAAMQTASGAPLSQSTRATRRSRLPGGLVAAQLALTCTLLFAAGLFLRTFLALQAAPLGFNPHGVTELTLMPVNPRESSDAAKQTRERLLGRLGSLPGVEAAASELSLPFSGFNLGVFGAFRITGHPARKGDQTSVSFLSPGYARALGVTLVNGRDFLPNDRAGAQTVGMVNQAFVRRFLPGKPAVGQSLEFVVDATDGMDNRLLKTPVALVGVLPDQLGGSLSEEPDPVLFLPYAQFPSSGPLAHFIFGISPQFAVRSTLPQAALERELRGALKEAAPDMAEMQIGSMEANIAASLTRQKLALRLAGGFGLLALALAAVGIYGVLASSVAQRTREIGIRMALGSSRGRAVGLVLRQAAGMVLVGLGAGFVCAWPAGRAVRAFLFGVAPLDPLTLALSACTLLLACALAAAVPAWRAASVDPVIALRSE